MNFGFTEEQELLRQQVRRFFDNKSPITAVREVMTTKEGYSDQVWQEMSELGLQGLITPEEYGGSGLSWVDLIVVLEESGRTLVPSPYISHMIATMLILEAGTEEQKQQWLPELAQGQKIASIALFDEANHYSASAVQLKGAEGDELTLIGTKHFVPEFSSADLFIVAYKKSNSDSEISFALVEKNANGLSSKASRPFDKTKREGVLTFNNVNVSNANILKPKNSNELIELAINCGAVAVTAEAIGVAEAAHKMTVDYANERTQFGSKIGRYQGVKHPLAEMYVDIESFKSLLYYASWCVTNKREDLSRFASLAKAYASDVMPKLGTDCIQLHGAIGYTAEYDIQLYYKRAKWMRPIYGDANFHYDRIADLGGL